jgi:hypothetical protein
MSVCPGCGRCRQCGQPVPMAPAPYYPYYPYYPTTVPNLTVIDRLAMRERARGIGDANLERACNADLALNGYRDENALETTVDPTDGFERAVPPQPKRGGRPKLPRCEHNNIIGRCLECSEEGVDENE